MIRADPLINGTGFGASTGTLLFFSVNGNTVAVTPSSWTTTVIQATIPSTADLTGSATAFFVAVPLGSTVGLKSALFQVLPALVSSSQFQNGTLVFAKLGLSLPVAAPFQNPVGRVISGGSPPTTYNCAWYNAPSSETNVVISSSGITGVAGSASLASLKAQGISI